MPRPIDDSKTPYKRSPKTGPGPKGQTISRTQDWECERGKNTAKHYVQICTYVGENAKRRGKKRKVKTLRSKKKKYNKLHKAWMKKNEHAWQRKGPMRSYTCRQTKIAKCRGWASPIIPLPVMGRSRRSRKRK